MADVVDPATRSRMMGNIRGRNTKPEKLVRSALHRRGFRYRLDDRRLPGRPDLVFPRYRAVVFIHGCFWHRHAGCRLTATPQTRPQFWNAKFEANVERDRSAVRSLLGSGWRVGIIWECATRSSLSEVVDRMSAWLISDEPTFSSD